MAHLNTWAEAHFDGIEDGKWRGSWKLWVEFTVQRKTVSANVEGLEYNATVTAACIRPEALNEF